LVAHVVGFRAWSGVVSPEMGSLEWTCRSITISTWGDGETNSTSNNVNVKNK
jgi:hypothetical protein